MLSLGGPQQWLHSVRSAAQLPLFLLLAPVSASRAPRQLCQEESLLSGWEERSPLKGSLTSIRGSPPDRRGSVGTYYYTDRCRQVPGQHVLGPPASISTRTVIASPHTGRSRAADTFGELVRITDHQLKARQQCVGSWYIHSVAIKDLQ